MNFKKIKEKIEEAAAKLKGGIIAVGFHNLATDEEFFYNGNHVFPAASIVKIHILLEYLRQKDEDLINPDEELTVKEEDIVGGAGVLFEMHMGLRVTLQDLVHLMIVISDNTASNMILDRVGMENVNKLSRSIGMQDSVVGRKFMIDPKTKFSMNFTSVRDMIKLLADLYNGEILSKNSTQEALNILSRQQYREKIPALLPNHITVAHKTGEITGVRHDCGIVIYPPAPYVLCFLTEKLSDTAEGDRTLAQISKMIFDEISETP